MRRGILQGKASKSNLNTKSSTEPEVADASDYKPWTLWTKWFLEEQGCVLRRNIFYQDLQGKASKSNLNTKSSTEPEVADASDYKPWTLWTKWFLEEQGCVLRRNIFYQDNVSWEDCYIACIERWICQESYGKRYGGLTDVGRCFIRYTSRHERSYWWSRVDEEGHTTR